MSNTPSVPETQVDVFAGHLGHLTKDEEDAFAQFKDILNSAKLYTPATDTAPASHDDPTLLYVRFFLYMVQDLKLFGSSSLHILQPISPRTQLPTWTCPETICRRRSMAKTS